MGAAIMTATPDAAALRARVASAMCKADGTAQCAAICLSYFASSTRAGKCPEACRVWGRKADAAIAALSAAPATRSEIESVSFTPVADVFEQTLNAGGTFEGQTFVLERPVNVHAGYLKNCTIDCSLLPVVNGTTDIGRIQLSTNAAERDDAEGGA